MLAFYILREGRPESLYMKWIVFNLKRVNFTLFKKVKVKWSRYRPGVAQKVGRGIALLFHDRGTRRGERSAARPGRTLPPGKTRYPLYRRLGGSQGRSGRAENLVHTGIRSRSVQPVAQPLYRLSYRSHESGTVTKIKHESLLRFVNVRILCVHGTDLHNAVERRYFIDCNLCDGSLLRCL